MRIASAAGSMSGLEVFDENDSQGWARVQLTGAVPGDWQDAITEYGTSGMNVVAFDVDEAGGWIRWNPVENPSAIVIMHPGGGGSGGWGDYRQDGVDITDPTEIDDWLVANPTVMMVGVRWFNPDISGYFISSGRFTRKSADGDNFTRQGTERVQPVLDWIVANLAPAAVPIAMRGGSAGALAIMEAVLGEASWLDRVVHFSPMGIAPAWDLVNNCNENTPAGTWVDPATGALGAEGAQFVAGAALKIGTTHAGQWIDRIKAISPTCADLNMTQVVAEPSNLVDRLPATTDLTGVMHHQVGTQGEGGDIGMGVVWAQGQLMAHALFADLDHEWHEYTDFGHSHHFDVGAPGMADYLESLGAAILESDDTVNHWAETVDSGGVNHWATFVGEEAPPDEVLLSGAAGSESGAAGVLTVGRELTAEAGSESGASGALTLERPISAEAGSESGAAGDLSVAVATTLSGIAGSESGGEASATVERRLAAVAGSESGALATLVQPDIRLVLTFTGRAAGTPRFVGVAQGSLRFGGGSSG